MMHLVGKFTFVLCCCLLQVLGYNSTDLNQDIYIRDKALVNVIPVNSSTTVAGSVTQCAAKCMDTKCIGFFYNNVTRLCIPVDTNLSFERKAMENVIFFKRQVKNNSLLVSQDPNVCPSLHEGVFIFNATSNKQYEIYMSPQPINHDQAVKLCQGNNKRLLRMEENWQYLFIKHVLTSCDDFKGKEFWIGATEHGLIWQFPDCDKMDEKYFCDNAPHQPDKQFCARFLNGCLEDQMCENSALVMCD